MAWLSPSELVTADFTLRPFRIGDGPALFDAVDASRSHLLPHIRWVENHVDVEASEWDARGMAARYLNDTDFALAIARGDEILGGTGFHLRGRALAEHVAE